MPESQCVLKEGWNRPSGATGLALLSLSFLYCVIAQWHSAPNLNCCHGVWCSGHGAPVFCVLSDGGSCCHASACLVVLIDYAWRMRRMNAFIAPSVIHDCHNLLRCATAGTGSARVTKPCARSVVPLVYPSSASGYFRRAPSLRWACRTAGADSADKCHGHSLRVLTCSATLTESELQKE